MRRGQMQKIQHLSRWVMGLFVGLSLLLVGRKVLTTPDVSAETKKVKLASDTKLKAKVTTSSDVTHRTLARLQKLVDLQARAHERLRLEVQRSLRQQRQVTKEKVSKLFRRIQKLQREIQAARQAQVKQRQRMLKRTQYMQSRIRNLEVLARTMSQYQTLLQHWLHPTRKPGERQAIASLSGAYRRWIPGGMFQMGSLSTEPDRSSNEGPRRWVWLRKSYWMMETEVTQAQFQLLMGYNPSHFKSCGLHCPVEQVNWHEAAAFANKLSKRAGLSGCFVCTGSGSSVECKAKSRENYVKCRGWRLATEAEWERAYRAGTESRFYTGKCISTDQANYNGNHPGTGCGKGAYRKTTMPVGSFEANPWGLKDMAGNVWEWTYDWYQDSYRGLYSLDPVGPSSGSYRVFRSGCWLYGAGLVRAAYRNNGSPGIHYDGLGIRLVRVGP